MDILTKEQTKCLLKLGIDMKDSDFVYLVMDNEELILSSRKNLDKTVSKITGKVIVETLPTLTSGEIIEKLLRYLNKVGDDNQSKNTLELSTIISSTGKLEYTLSYDIEKLSILGEFYSGDNLMDIAYNAIEHLSKSINIQ